MLYSSSIQMNLIIKLELAVLSESKRTMGEGRRTHPAASSSLIAFHVSLSVTSEILGQLFRPCCFYRSSCFNQNSRINQLAK